MPEYKCIKCGTEFKKKWSYEYHLNRKNPCIGNNREEIENFEDNNNLNNKKDNDNDKDTNKEIFDKEDINELNCQFCKKSYSSISNLNKHLKGCKVKINKEKEEENEKKRIENEKKEIEKKNMQNSINKPITIHISKINATPELFNNLKKKEDFEKMKDNDTNNNNINNKIYNDNEKELKNKNQNQTIDDFSKLLEKKFTIHSMDKEKNENNNQKNLIKEEYESEFIKEIRKELSELKDYIKNNQNNNNPVSNHYTFLTQINQNFFIHNFGKECVDSIQTDFYFNLLSSPYESVPKLVEEIHFNKQNPYNTNIILPNQNLPFIYVYENGKWIIANKESTLNQLVDKNFERVDDFYDHYKNYLEKTIIENYEKYSNEYVETNLKEDIQKDVSNVLERGSQQIIETIIEKRKNASIQDNKIDSNTLLNMKDVNVLNDVFNPNKKNDNINKLDNSMLLSLGENELIKKAKNNLLENGIQIEDYEK